MKRLTILILIFCWGMPSFVNGQNSFNQDSLISLFNQRGETYISFSKNDISKKNIKHLSSIISFDKIVNDSVFAYINNNGYKFLNKIKVPISFHVPPSMLLSKKQLMVSGKKNSLKWDFYPGYNQYLAIMDNFGRKYPSLCKVISIGKSVKGRELLFAHISVNNNVIFKPSVTYSSTIHGDETTGYILMLHMIDYLLSNYNKVPEITRLVDSFDIWINPLANPDGTYAAGDTSVYGATRFNANHIDLNRNFPDPAAGDHPDGNSWQPETIAFMNFAQKHHFVLSAVLHTGAEVVNYPWDTWAFLPADNDWWVNVSRKYADTVHKYSFKGYFTDLDNGITNGYAWYSITGGRQDYMNYFHYDREFTLELSHVKMPDPTELPNFWNYNFRSLIQYLKEAKHGLYGLVKDSISGNGVKAEILIENHDNHNSQVYSDSITGVFFRPLYKGKYIVKVSSEGYEPYIKEILFDSISGNKIIINLKPVSSGVNGISDKNVRAFPNPAINYLSFTGLSTSSKIQLFNISGRKVVEKTLMNNEKWNISSLPKGIYIAKIHYNNRVVIIKIILKN